MTPFDGEKVYMGRLHGVPGIKSTGVCAWLVAGLVVVPLSACVVPTSWFFKPQEVAILTRSGVPVNAESVTMTECNDRGRKWRVSTPAGEGCG